MASVTWGSAKMRKAPSAGDKIHGKVKTACPSDHVVWISVTYKFLATG
jgi:hypothetical protein